MLTHVLFSWGVRVMRQLHTAVEMTAHDPLKRLYLPYSRTSDGQWER